MTDLLRTAALICTAMGVLASGLVLLGRRTGLALRVLLDFLLAAGLLRLSARPDWPELGAAVVIIAVRRLLGSSLRSS